MKDSVACSFVSIHLDRNKDFGQDIQIGKSVGGVACPSFPFFFECLALQISVVIHQHG